MNISEYIAAKTPEKIVVTVTDELNPEYTRKKSFTGVSMLADDFRPEDSNGCTVAVYATAGGALVVHTEDREGGVMETYENFEELIASDVAENVKSAVAAELGEVYVEEVEL